MIQVHSFLMIKTMRIFLKGMISLLTQGTKGAKFTVWTQGSERAGLFVTFFGDMKQVGGCEVFRFGVRNSGGVAVVILVIILFVLHFYELLNSNLETNSFLLAIFYLLSLNNRHRYRSYSTLNSVASEHISKTLKQAVPRRRVSLSYYR